MGILSWLRTRGSCRRAIDASQQGRLREAVVGFQEVLDTAETNWQAWCALGECHYALGDLHAARWAFDRCLELNPQSVEAKQGRALLYGEQDHDWDDGDEQPLLHDVPL